MSENNTYNGYTNYATWRVNLEFGFNDGGYENTTADTLQEIVESQIEETSTGLAQDYALAFISDVNWYEIAESLEEEEEEEEE